MRYTINLDCKTHHVSKDKTFPILLRVSLNGKQDYFNIGKRINADHYDKNLKKVKTFKGSSAIERIINNQKLRIENIIDNCNNKGEIISITRLKELYNLESNGTKSTCFYEYVNKRIEWEKSHLKIKPNTFKFIEGNLARAKKYKPKLSIYDIDEKYLEGLRAYLMNTLGHKSNTAYHAMCFIRKYTKQLLKDGTLKKSPFDNFKVGSPFESNLVYLEPEELIQLHDLYESKTLLNIVKTKSNKYAKDFNVGVKYQEVLRYFLVACYTGLRHSDVKTLRREHITGNHIVKKLVKGSIDREKTVRIPINKNFNSLIDLNNSNGLLFDNPVMEDAQTNKYLLEIMKIAKINKHITFHKARYTFGIVSLILGVDIAIVSNVLGHSELTTTQRYAKVVDSHKNSQMSKWDKFRMKNVLSNEIELCCSNCSFTLLKSEIGVIVQKRIICKCPICLHHSQFDLIKNSVALVE
jgi:integrase